MKILCTLSNTYFYTTDFRNLKVEGIHPFFSLPTRTLLSRTGDWAQGKLTEDERRVLFLSLLHSMRNTKGEKLVEFRTAAIPSDRTIQYSIELLIKTVGWHNAIDTTAIPLPRYVVNHATRDLRNIHDWLKVWNDTKDDWKNNNFKSAEAKRKLEKLIIREESLSKLIKSYNKKSEDYAWLIAKWSMLAGSVPAELQEYWTSLIKLKGHAVYLAETNDLDEMVEHMEMNLPHGSIYAHATLKHVRNLLYKNKSGDFGLGIPSGTDLEGALANPFKFVEDATETHNKNTIIASAPEKEPIISDYSSKFEYLKAKAAWGLAKSANDQIEAYQKQQDDAAKLDMMIFAEGKALEGDAALDAIQDAEFAKEIAEDSEEKDDET